MTPFTTKHSEPYPREIDSIDGSSAKPAAGDPGWFKQSFGNSRPGLDEQDGIPTQETPEEEQSLTETISLARTAHRTMRNSRRDRI